MPLELARSPEDLRFAVAAGLRNAGVADDRKRDHVRIITGPQPYRHAHYQANEFFIVDQDSGSIHTIYGQRVLRVTENFLRTLTESLGERAPKTLYRLGQTWGSMVLADFIPRIEQEYEVEFSKLGMGAMLESLWWPMRAAGWGTWRTDFRQARSGMIVVEVADSVCASAAGACGTYACSLYAGLFGAVFSHLAKRALQSTELECVSRGDECCRFLVATENRIQAAIRERDSH